MDKRVYEFLKDISSQSEEINSWEQITNTFVNAIKRKGFNQEQVRVINEIIYNEIGKSNKIAKDKNVKNKWV